MFDPRRTRLNPPAVRNISCSDAADMIGSRGALMIDVREPFERAEASIAGTTHIPLGELLERLGELPRDRPLILQCRSGNRSHGAAEALQASGFSDVYNLSGGIIAWAREGRSLEK